MPKISATGKPTALAAKQRKRDHDEHRRARRHIVGGDTWFTDLFTIDSAERVDEAWSLANRSVITTSSFNE